jgi:glycosyltransferase involved in cell wall biosynthesis
VDWACDLFRLIKRTRPEAFFLAITPQVSRMDEACCAAGICSEDYKAVAGEPTTVPAYLGAADLGLLLRERTLVNEVASPVKFGEYLAAGVPVVITDGVGDLSTLVNDRGVGVVLSAEAWDERMSGNVKKVGAFLANYDRDASGMRERCRVVARTELSVRLQVQTLLSLYARLASKPSL